MGFSKMRKASKLHGAQGMSQGKGKKGKGEK